MVRFYFRCRQMTPTIASPQGYSVLEHPKPGEFEPVESWTSEGSFDTDWTYCLPDSLDFLPGEHMFSFESSSVLWHQPTQSIWVAPCDMTRPPRDPEHPLDVAWGQLTFRKHDNGMWEVGSYLVSDQIEKNCLEGNPVFHQILPKQLFQHRPTSGQDTDCRLFGRLSVILGLIALWLDGEKAIKREIPNFYYDDDSPCLRPQQPMIGENTIDRYEWPGRALVMQIGGFQSTGEDLRRFLDDCKKGQCEPMLSSQLPTTNN